MDGLISTLFANESSVGQPDGLSNVYWNDSHLEDPKLESFTLEPSRDPLYIVVPVTIIYASIFFTGTIGNISTCVVIARNKSMHTATNYYLFSLAISDLLLLVSGLPPEIYLVWCKYPYIFGEGFCVLRGLAAETSANASVLTITAFTVERYLAICHPFFSQTMSRLSRAVKLILLIWLVALSFALPQALQFGVIQHERNPNFVMCTMKRILLDHSFELSTFLFFVVPMSVITVLYALIGLRLRKSNMMKKNPGRTQLSRNSRVQPGRSSQRVLKMLVAVVIAFFICWAPFHVQRLIAIYGTDSEDRISSKSKWIAFLYLLMTYISGVLYYFSTTINPILYNIMSNKFRVAFMETLSRSCRVPGCRVRTEQRSYSSLSRSQQRTVAESKTPGTAIGIGPESTEYTANSRHEDASREPACDADRPLEDVSSESRKSETPNEQEATGTDLSRVENIERERGSVQRLKETCPGEQRYFGDDSLRSKPVARYAMIRISRPDEPGKKWWRFLKRLPGLRSLKFPGGCAVQEHSQSRCEELSMTMWNVYEPNDPRPI